MAAALGLPQKPRPRLRFTIGGLLVCTLIVSVGLARWRLPGATVLAAGLASLSAWLLVGLVRSLGEAWGGARQFGRLPREAKWSVGLDIGFSVAGMLVCLLVIGIGLTRRQQPALTTTNELLACFGAWLVIGALQRAVHGVGELCVSSELSRPAWWGLVVSVAARLGIAVLAAISVYFAVVQGMDLPGDWFELQGMSVLAFLIFFLAVVCAYWSPRTAIAEGSLARQTRRRMGEWTLFVIGVFWAGIVLLNPGAFAALVHIAIRGVEAYQPTRWTTQDLHPANLGAGVSDQYFGGAIAAGSLLLAAIVANLVMIRWWHCRRTRNGLLSLSLVCLVAIVGLLSWFRFQLLPEYSPILAAGVGEQAPTMLPLAGVLATAVATVFAWWYVASPQPGDSPFVPRRLPAKAFLHEHPAVMAVGLAGGIAAIARNISESRWGWWSWVMSAYGRPLGDFLIEEPFKLISVAAVLVLGQRLWAWWRGRVPAAHVTWQIEPCQFAAAWVAAFITLVLLMPVATWFGSAVLLRLMMPL